MRPDSLLLTRLHKSISFIKAGSGDFKMLFAHRSINQTAGNSLLNLRRASHLWFIIGAMKQLTRITLNPQVMGGKPCIRGLRITVGTIVGLFASGHSPGDILKLYPYLEEEDLREALGYAAWRAQEIELPLVEA